MAEFGSLITAMITPFHGESSPEYIEGNSPVDYDALEKLVKHLIETGSDSILLAGTTGECPTLTHDEEREIFKFVKEKANAIDPGVKIIFGTGSNSTQTVIESNQAAEEMGADGLLIVTPYYNKPNAKGLKAHFSKLANETSLPIILYNIPGRSVINMDADLIKDLVFEHSNIVGLKEATNNLDQISELRQNLSFERFKIYSGDDSLTLPMMSVGADGVISVASHVVGNEMKVMINAFLDGDPVGAEEIHRKLFPIFKALFTEPNPTCVKEALSILDICSPVLREPLVELDKGQKLELKAIMESMNLLSSQGSRK